LAPVPLSKDAAVLLRVDPETDTVTPLNHRPVHAYVDPILLRVASDHHVRGADIAPAVADVPARSRKALDVNVVALLDALHDRTIFHHSGRNGRGGFAFFAPETEQLQRMNIGWQLHRESEAAGRRPDGVGGNAVADRVAGELVEHEHRPVPLSHQLGEAANFQVQAGALHIAHFTHGIGSLDEISQRLIRHGSFLLT
jgi:hypothetical protein